jgi:hypothetical protein
MKNFVFALASFSFAAFLSGCSGGTKYSAPALPSPSSLGPSCTSATVDSSYSCQIVVSSGKAPFTWNVTGLPAGLKSTVSGDTKTLTISGTPSAQVAAVLPRASSRFAAAANASTTASVQVTVTDATGKSASLSFNITLTSAAGLAISTTSPLPGGTAGAPYSAMVTATGGVTPYTWTITGLPAGLTSSSATPSATISGTTNHVGAFSITAKVSDSASTPATASVTLSLTISQAATLMVTTTTLPNGMLNTAYSQTLSATGGVGPDSWTLASGTLPTGLAISSGGVISGTPTAGGSFSFTVQATDAESPSQTAKQALSITINTTSSGLSITTKSPLPGATLGSTYSAMVTASGGTPPYTWSLGNSSTLPSGLSLTSGSPAATVTGKPTTTGTFQFTLDVKDSAGTPATVSASFTVTVTGSSTLNCPAIVNLTLCGSYLLGVHGFVGTTGPVAMGASFVADSSGHIVSGVEDINSVSGAQTDVLVTGGSYVMDASGDGRGLLTLIDSNALSRTFRFVLESAANAGGGAVEEFDASGVVAAGSLQGPGTPPFATIPANAVLAVRLEGVNGANKRAGMLGEFQVGSSGCNGASGSFNSMAGEHVVSNTAGTVNAALTITGSCTAPDPNTGRGTAQITISGGTPFADTTLNFVFYAVGTSASGLLGLFLGEVDAIGANQPILNGLAQVVGTGGGFTSCAAPAACILAGVGTTDGTVTTGHGVALLVRGTASPVTTTTGTIAGVLDKNFGGAITSAGTWPYSAYTIDANGIGTITGTGPTIHFVGDGGFMDESVSVIMGDSSVQNATTLESPGAPYIIGESLGSGGVGATLGARHVVGVVTPSAVSMGTFSGTLDVSSSAGQVVGATASGSYTISTNGRGTGTANFTGSTSVAVVIYANRHRRFSVLDMQSSDPYVLGARLQ